MGSQMIEAVHRERAMRQAVDWLKRMGHWGTWQGERGDNKDEQDEADSRDGVLTQLHEVFYAEGDSDTFASDESPATLAESEA